MGWRMAVGAGLICGLLGIRGAGAQGVDSAGGRVPKFDVISIRRSAPGTRESFTTNITKDGYKAKGQSLYMTIMAATSRQPWMSWSAKRFTGAPGWVMDDLYDIDAKVTEEDLPEWQKQGNTPAQTEMFHAMLLAALVERCGLKLHQVPGETTGYALVVGKRGVKFKEAEASIPAAGMPLLGGGRMVNGGGTQMSFYSASMKGFVTTLTIISGGSSGMPLIQDETGLSGKYDFVLHKHKRDAGEAGDPDSGPTRWDLEEIGLMLKPVKVPVETIVVDHVERPTEN